MNDLINQIEVYLLKSTENFTNQDQIEGLHKIFSESLCALRERILPLDPSFSRSIKTLELTARSYHCLKGENILIIGALIQYSKGQLLVIPGLGRKSWLEISIRIQDMGFYLNYPLSDWEKSKIKKLNNIMNDDEN